MKRTSKINCGWNIGNIVLLLNFFFITTGLQAQKDNLKAQIISTKSFMLQQSSASDYRDSIRKSVLEYENSLSNHCKNVNLEFDSVSVKLQILMLVEMNGKGKPVSGSWKETIPGISCTEKRMYNVVVDVTKNGLRFTSTYPGEAQGNADLQRDTLKIIETDERVMPGVNKPCPVEVLDTRLVGPKQTLREIAALTPWSEAWEVRLCGQVYTVPVKYTPDKKGIAISVGASEAIAH
jgi:hypothetical protein